MRPPAFLCRCVRFLFLLAVVFRPAGDTRAGTVYQSLVGGWTVKAVSPAMIAGRPAVVWAEGTLAGRLLYARADDELGTAWGAPVVLGGWGTGSMVLRVIEGRPAVCYAASNLSAILYQRALDETGSAWGAFTVLPFSGAGVQVVSMDVVEGRPVVCFLHSGAENVSVIRATDATGTGWEPPVVVASGGVTAATMAVVDGRPAVAWVAGHVLAYARAGDSAGTVWPSGVTLSGDLSIAAPPITGIQIVNGNPAICFAKEFPATLNFVRAQDSAGEAWNAPVVIDADGFFDYAASLAVVRGKPAAAYFSGNASTTKFVEAADADGTAWRPRLQGGSAGTLSAPVLFPVGERAGLFYANMTRRTLEYELSTAGPGPIVWPPVMVVSQPATLTVENGATRSMGRVMVGRSEVWTFTVWNSGGTALTIASSTIDGPDAAEFSFFQLPPAVLGPGSTATFMVKYSPVTPGHKTALLHLTSNAALPSNNYTLTLTGDSLPDLAVQLANGTSVSDGAVLTVPLVPPGRAGSTVFRVSNSGEADLTGLAITIDGPDAGAFSIFPPLPASLRPLESVTFTARHAPRTPGPQTATLHIASNLVDSRSPWDITLRTGAGAVDDAFHPNISGVLSLAVAPGGRILAGGTNFVSAFKPDGTPDLTFFSPPVTGNVTSIAVQRNGGILIAGPISFVGEQTLPGIRRLLPTGDVDPSFHPGINRSVLGLQVLPDDRVLVGGSFREVAGTQQSYLVRLTAAGELETTFQPAINSTVTSLALQPDGRLLTTGFFLGDSPETSLSLQRFKPDGSLSPLAAAHHDAFSLLTARPDGSLLAAYTAGGIRLLLPDGSFAAADPVSTPKAVTSFALLTNGACLAAGAFPGGVGLPDPGLIRLRADGTPDPDFAAAASGAHRTLAVQADGKVLLAGPDTLEGETIVQPFSRLTGEPAFTSLRREGASTLRWLRSGGAPEVSDVSFEVNTLEDTAWVPAGFATRIPGGWELTGLTLPEIGQVRARGRAGGSLIEETAPLRTGFETWRLLHFQTLTPDGAAAPSADPDHDGLANLLEYAFALSPVDHAADALPSFVRAGKTLTTTFPGRPDVLYNVEWSPDMTEGTWTAVPDSGSGENHTFVVPAEGARVFTRFVVTVK